MKTSSVDIRDNIDVSKRRGGHRVFSGFTLVEMLVVIVIIGILAALVIPAALSARNAAKRGTVKMEISQIEMALQEYKNKFGEYPPDFSGDLTNASVQQTIMRHLAKAFPRYQPGVGPTAKANSLTGFNGFLCDVQDGWGLPVTNSSGSAIDPNYLLSPSTALAFWLGGCPQWLSANGIAPPTTAARPITAFAGFAADTTNPFQPPPPLPSGAPSTQTTCQSRTAPFYDFNLTCLYYVSGTRSSTTPGGLWVWPTSACNNTSSPYCPLVYFRAENGNYTTDGLALAATMANAKYVTVPLTSSSTVNVWPAVDTRLSTPASAPPLYTWVNPSSVQIFSGGLNIRYAMPYADKTFYSGVTGNTGIGPYEFPTGVNYSPDTYGNITNFSTNTLEDSMK